MRKLTIIITVIICVFTAVSCSNEKLELVEDITPVHTWDEETINVLEELKEIPAEERKDYLQSHAPRLTDNVINLLKQYNKIDAEAEVDSVIYYFGSSEEAKAYDKKGQLYEGKFDDRLVAFVWINGEKDPYMVLVQCLNGMVSFIGELSEIMTISKFTITKGDCLLNHVSYEMSCNLAEDFNLKITKKPINGDYETITIQEARSLENETDRNLVVIEVFPGDHFNLTNGIMIQNNVTHNALTIQNTEL